MPDGREGRTGARGAPGGVAAGHGATGRVMPHPWQGTGAPGRG